MAPLYLDASALVKLIAKEPESPALTAYVGGASMASSELVLAEVPRAIRRLRTGRRRGEQEGLAREMERVLRQLAFVPLTRKVVTDAGRYPEAFLRTLDAVHLASAITIEAELGTFVSYDERQIEAARHAGLGVAFPR